MKTIYIYIIPYILSNLNIRLRNTKYLLALIKRNALYLLDIYIIFFLLVSKIKKQVFVLIDEYDNFANELITGGKQNTCTSILHGEGFVKVFYKALKDATADNFARIFMTCVSPIMLDDLTSGFNITRNYTLDKNLNAMLGFTRACNLS